ncbi:NAD(P)-dependent oxidoreductase [Pusillimonas sp. SM2304]|uniref:NAD(P)-dependent oxidoreductase n=1 Tax=Pusillimonas sp. SM2304 TaxID=3073241 RepID=UPI002874AAAD|nr:NAD(P)-dependent oxidoreductase [Pusillimonas sp. SM2304]MDS1139777.1 NAD(P)-dependent oxidoreductase [Pusillimonas sp. SM2304]
MDSTVGFIGLGHMGGAIAEQYLKAGHKTVVFDLSEKLMAKLAAQGAQAAGSARQLADSVDIIVACLPSPAASHAVALGEQGICHGRKVKFYIETSTIGVMACKNIAAGLAQYQIQMIDAPVSGGPRAAAQGKLTSMVAAPAAAWDQASPVINAYSGKTFLVGKEPGLAQACKLVNNALSLSTLALACETAVFGVAAGLDAHTMIEVINASSGRSAATQDKFPASILNRHFDYGASVRTAAKDLALFVQEAQALGMDVSGTSRLADIWKNAEAAGDPERDFTTLIQHYETAPDVIVGRPA